MGEIVAEAKRAGLETVGISDHYGKIHDLSNYVKTVRTEQERQKIRVLLGLEIDVPDSCQLEYFYKIKQKFGFDYFIGSVHGVRYNGTYIPVGDKNKKEILQSPLYQQTYWQTLSEMACGLFDIIAHLDLIKITGIDTTYQFEQEIDAALKAFKAYSQIVEINTRHSETECSPSDAIISKICRVGIPVIFSSDAHIKDKVTHRFESEQKRLHRQFSNLNHITGTNELLHLFQERESALCR